MTIENTDTRRKVSGDDSTVTFSFPFKIYSDEDISVLLQDKDALTTEDQELGVDFTVTIDPVNEGGTITFIGGVVPTSDEWVFMFSGISRTQTVAIPIDGKLREENLENGLDRLCRLIQQIGANSDRALTLPATSDLTQIEVPTPEAGKVMKWNADEDGFENSTYDPDEVAEEAEASATAAAASASSASSSASSASASASSASDSADAAAASAASIDLPDIDPGDAQKILEVNAGENGYDHITLASAVARIFSSEAQAEAGTDDTTVMNPLRVAQAIAALGNAALQVKVGSFTYDLSTATGSQNISGVGFTPKAVLIFAKKAGGVETFFSQGFSDGSTHVCTYYDTGDNPAISTSACVRATDGTDTQVAVVNSFSSDGFQLGWTKSNTPTGTLTCGYLAIG